MKSIFAGVGFIVVLLLVASALNGRTPIFDGWRGSESSMDGGCRHDPIFTRERDARPSFEYESASRRNQGGVWVQPVYRWVNDRGTPRQVIVRQGHWSAQSSQEKQKHIGFDVAGIISAFK